MRKHLDINSEEYKNLVQKLLKKSVDFAIPTTDKPLLPNLSNSSNSSNSSSNMIIVPTTECVKIDSLRLKWGKDFNLEKWMKVENNLYSGRRGRIFIGSDKNKKIFHYPDSKWRNPYKVPEYSLEESLNLYERYVREKLLEDIHELEGKNLGCFCDQKNPCHTQILVKLFKEKIKMQ